MRARLHEWSRGFQISQLERRAESAIRDRDAAFEDYVYFDQRAAELRDQVEQLRDNQGVAAAACRVSTRRVGQEARRRRPLLLG